MVEKTFNVEESPQGYRIFTFKHVNEESVTGWQILHGEMYRDASNTACVCFLINLPKGELVPFAHITQRARAWFNGDNPFLPTRHAWITDAEIPIDLIQGLVKTLPKVDLKVRFFRSAQREDAEKWLLDEIHTLNSVAGTNPIDNSL